MLKKDVYKFDKNVFEELNERWAIVVAGDRKTGINGMTISWGTFGVLWNKPVAMVFVRKSRYTHDFLDKTDSITLSFLSDEYKDAKVLFGRKSGREIDKFKETGLHPSLAIDFNGYFIAEADYVFKCKKLMEFDLDSSKLPVDIKEGFYKDNDIHTVYICEIKEYLINELKK